MVGAFKDKAVSGVRDPLEREPSTPAKVLQGQQYRDNISV